MKLTPRSTARRKTFLAFSRSGGQPQIPSPVMRIAPKPSRFTDRSAPNKNVSPLLLMLLLILVVAAVIFCKIIPPAITPAPPAIVVPRNFRRVMLSIVLWLSMTSTDVSTLHLATRLPRRLTDVIHLRQSATARQACD